MQRTMLSAKIHRATVTEADLNYVGSLTLDKDLMDAAGMLEYEKVGVLNVHNGQRFDTYLLEGKPGSGQLCLNGAAARLGARGDLVILVTYATMDEKEARSHKPRQVFVDANNKIVSLERHGLAAS